MDINKVSKLIIKRCKKSVMIEKLLDTYRYCCGSKKVYTIPCFSIETVDSKKEEKDFFLNNDWAFLQVNNLIVLLLLY